MKQLSIILLLCCILFSGCQANPEPTTEPTAPPQTIPVTEPGTEPTPTETVVYAAVTYDIYLPNGNADGFLVETVETDQITADGVLAELQARGVLNETVILNAFGSDGTQLNMDFNQAFADQVCSMGTSGELMIVGSVVNTFLSAFQAESVCFTINGEILESGHVIYDFPLTYYPNN